MNSYKTYKKVRMKASIMGMPTPNFWVMVIVDALLLLVLSTGLTLLKLIFVLLGMFISYLLARFVFNMENIGNINIKDYTRNK